MRKFTRQQKVAGGSSFLPPVQDSKKISLREPSFKWDTITLTILPSRTRSSPLSLSRTSFNIRIGHVVVQSGASLSASHSWPPGTAQGLGSVMLTSQELFAVAADEDFDLSVVFRDYQCSRLWQAIGSM